MNKDEIKSVIMSLEITYMGDVLILWEAIVTRPKVIFGIKDGHLTLYKDIIHIKNIYVITKVDKNCWEFVDLEKDYKKYGLGTLTDIREKLIEMYNQNPITFPLNAVFEGDTLAVNKKFFYISKTGISRIPVEGSICVEHKFGTIYRITEI